MNRDHVGQGVGSALALPHAPGDLLEVPEPTGLALAGAPTAAAALGLIELIERLKSRLDAAALAAWRMLHAAYLEALAEPGRPAATAGERDWSASVAHSGAVDEVMAATGLGESECRRRLSLAVADPARVDTLLALLAVGDLALWQVIGLHEDTADLTPVAADEVVRAVTAPCRDGSRPSHQLRRRRLRRELTRRGGDPSRNRIEALTRRDAHAELRPDGSGCVWVTGDGGRVVAAIERVDTIARRIRAAGRHPNRTLAQLRSDVALDLLLKGTVAGSSSTAPAAPVDVAVVADAASVCAPTGPLAEIDWVCLGDLPAAHVQVIVPLDVLTGAREGLAELPGHGWIHADHARDLALTLGSVWQRLVTDPLTGALVELSTHRYVPPPRVRAHVVTRDQVCRAPGCQVSATRCDLDHDVPWPTGPTTAGNLTAKHRRHHQLKTTGLWEVAHDPDTHEVTWTTLAGRRYITSPYDFRELLDSLPAPDTVLGAPHDLPLIHDHARPPDGPPTLTDRARPRDTRRPDEMRAHGIPSMSEPPPF